MALPIGRFTRKLTRGDPERRRITRYINYRSPKFQLGNYHRSNFLLSLNINCVKEEEILYTSRVFHSDESRVFPNHASKVHTFRYLVSLSSSSSALFDKYVLYVWCFLTGRIKKEMNFLLCLGRWRTFTNISLRNCHCHESWCTMSKDPFRLTKSGQSFGNLYVRIERNIV